LGKSPPHVPPLPTIPHLAQTPRPHLNYLTHLVIPACPESSNKY
jgi:hypothetical protein